MQPMHATGCGTVSLEGISFKIPVFAGARRTLAPSLLSAMIDMRQAIGNASSHVHIVNSGAFSSFLGPKSVLERGGTGVAYRHE